MKTGDLNSIKDLLGKYDLGKTSLEEERVLIEYFESEEIPSELLSYQAEFNYYSAFKNIQFTGSLPENLGTEGSSFFKKIGQFFSKWYVLSALILLPSSVILFTYLNRTVEEVPNVHQEEDKTNVPISIIKTDSTTQQKIVPQPKDTFQISETKTAPKKITVQPSNDLVVNEIDNVVAASQEKDSTEIHSQSIDTGVAKDSTRPEDTLVSKDPITTEGKGITKQKGLVVSSEYGPVTFNLSEKSTSGQLTMISHSARQAGIEYIYVVDRHRRKIHELNIVMIIKSTGERSQLWITVPKKGSFSEVLSWTVDENGNAVSLGPNKIDHKVKAIHPLD
ncbi:hypothetical protein POV27_07605 [Aureisphaera galaxeae]|uniref:hypothetical protein n=1 Tax=Aureisphaera galaxeae TaxID=1538023 RepID=UPI0023502880|nr:hypothetical protein [Aureisphaera galaxeae]MDC8003913.1 hypothetical protein [Aureisphaera galaxeae]